MKLQYQNQFTKVLKNENDFKDQGPVMLKNIQHPVHVWATSNINQTSSAMSSTDDDPKSKLV